MGILGMSPGNAHPYSWSAIINGVFNGDEITRIGYPAVSEPRIPFSKTEHIIRILIRAEAFNKG